MKIVLQNKAQYILIYFFYNEKMAENKIAFRNITIFIFSKKYNRIQRLPILHISHTYAVNI